MSYLDVESKYIEIAREYLPNLCGDSIWYVIVEYTSYPYVGASGVDNPEDELRKELQEAIKERHWLTELDTPQS